MKKANFWSLAVAFALAFAGTTDARAHSGSTVDGTLMHLIGNPAPQEGGGRYVFHNVHADDGHIVPVNLSGASLPPGGIKAALNKRVRVKAATNYDVMMTSPTQMMPVETLEILGPSNLIAADQFPLTGSRQYKSVLCRWSDVPGTPSLPAGYFDTQLGNVYPGFDNYFQEVSYGAANITGSSATATWITTLNPRSSYPIPPTGGNSSYLTAMAQDCVSAAEAAGVSFVGYEGINLMYNFKVDNCCAWGGGTTLTFATGSRGVSVTWMPYNPGSWGDFGWHDHGVLAHELSHSFGSPHSDDPSGYQYGNWWDVVSLPGINSGICFDPGTAYDANYGCIGQHPVADNKLAMGFIAPARLATHAVGAASTTYSIERAAQPPNAGGTHQVLKVMTPSAGGKYYTVESRKRVGYDINLPGDGVIIHEVRNNRVPSLTEAGDPAHLVRPDGRTTPTGGADPNLGGVDARFTAGQSFINVADNVKITVMSIDGVTGTAAVKVEPATAPGEYSFVATTSNVAEAAAAAVNIAVTRTAPFTSAGSVVWTTSNGTALAGTDFGTLGSGTQKTGTLTWAAGTGGTKNITVGLAASNIPIINDAGVVDGNKDFTITLSSPVGGVLGAQTTNTVTRIDTDSTISFAAGTADVIENGANINLTINRTGSTAVAQAVTFTTANGTAMAGTDFGTTTAQTTGVITFGIGETSKTIAVGRTTVAAPYIRIIDDATIEGPESFNVNLTSPTMGAALGAPSQAVVTIASNENGVSMSVASLPGINESSGAINVVVNRAGSAGAVDVNYGFTNGTAVQGTHYTLTPGTLHWNDGESGPKNIPVTIIDDGSPTPAARTFTVTLAGATGATLTAPMSTSVSIADNDNTVQFSVPTSVVTEGTANLMLTVTRTGAAAGQTAQVTWTANNGSAFAGTDFGIPGNVTPPTGTLNWAAGDLASKMVTIPILNDLVLEGAKTFTVELSAPVGPNLNIGTNSANTVTLNDNEKGIAFVQPTYVVMEGAPPNTVTVSVARTGPTTTTATANWATVNGTAESGKDFGILNNFAPRTGMVSWAIGDAANKTIVIPILNDTVGGEGAETFTIVLTAGAGYVLGAIPVATVTINDDDIPPQSNVEFSQPKYMVVENGLNAVLTVNRVDIGGGFGLAATVKYATVAGTALAVSDYTAPLATASLTWAGGDGAAKTISIPIVNNAIAESPESFKVVLSTPSPGLGFGTPTEATVLILDDDEAFPLDGAIPAGFSTPGGVTKGWHVSNDPGAYEGVFALKNDEIDDGETAGIEMTGTFVAGNVSFRVKVSSEPGFDRLTFFVDNVPQPLTWSGTAVAGWTLSPTYPLGAGVHTLKWVYSKDASVSVGLDAAYIDGLVTPAFTP